VENMQNKQCNTHVLWGNNVIYFTPTPKKEEKNVVAFGGRVCLLIFQHKKDLIIVCSEEIIILK
jgi:hypothetical protein